MLSLQVTLFLLIIVGALMKHLHIVNAEGQKCLNDLVIYLVLPCNIVKSFLISSDGDILRQFGLVLVLSIGVQIVSVILGKILYRNQEPTEAMNLRVNLLQCGISGKSGGRGIIWFCGACNGKCLSDSYEDYDVVLRYCCLYEKHQLEIHLQKGSYPSVHYCLCTGYPAYGDRISAAGGDRKAIDLHRKLQHGPFHDGDWNDPIWEQSA